MALVEEIGEKQRHCIHIDWEKINGAILYQCIVCGATSTEPSPKGL